jgi:heme-degrading monooxygenase HmoA
MRYVTFGLVIFFLSAVTCARAEDTELTALRKDIEDLRKRLVDANNAETAALKAENAKLRKQVADSQGTGTPPALKKGNVLSVIAIKTSQEEADAFVKAFTDSPKASHKMKGFLGLAVAENSKEPGSFLVISSWENEDALNAYVKSPEFVQDHEKSMSIKSAKTEKPARFVVKED